MPNKQEIFDSILASPKRTISIAQAGDDQLGPLKHLPGTWEGIGQGFNMIALPFAFKDLNYRLLVNKYNETLKFTIVDKKVPNRGVQKIQDRSKFALADHHEDVFKQTDQLVATLDYEQHIKQTAAEDFPVSGKAGGAGDDIHHEPGLWLYMANEETNGLDIARLSTIPHGDSVLALGKSLQDMTNFEIEEINGLPIGYDMPLEDDYFAPYRHFMDGHFDGFNPLKPHELLKKANEGIKIVKTTVLKVDSTVDTAGISNIPFIVRQANAASMKSTFWIHELAETDAQGNPKLRLQYSQIVMLDFFAREDGLPGLIEWPHVSINTLEKVCSLSK